MDYLKEIIARNPDLATAKNLRVDDVTNFQVDGLNVGSRVNYSYGKFNQNFRTESFPVLPREWEIHPEYIQRIGMKDGHICGTLERIQTPEDIRDEASRQRILAIQGNLEPYPFANWAGKAMSAIDTVAEPVEVVFDGIIIAGQWALVKVLTPIIGALAWLERKLTVDEDNLS